MLPDPHPSSIMAGVRAYTITIQYIQTVACYISKGAYPQTATEAAGVPVHVFEEWLRRGERKSKNGLYHMLAEEVRTASGKARVLAETEVWKKKPDVWLRYGPGRETPLAPGWSKMSSAAPRRYNVPPDYMLRSDVARFLGTLREKVAASPELNTLFLAALDDLKGLGGSANRG